MLLARCLFLCLLSCHLLLDRGEPLLECRLRFGETALALVELRLERGRLRFGLGELARRLLPCLDDLLLNLPERLLVGIDGFESTQRHGEKNRGAAKGKRAERYTDGAAGGETVAAAWRGGEMGECVCKGWGGGGWVQG